MVKVYFERGGYAQLHAVFRAEDEYMACLPTLELRATALGFDKVTETIA